MVARPFLRHWATNLKPVRTSKIDAVKVELRVGELSDTRTQSLCDNDSDLEVNKINRIKRKTNASTVSLFSDGSPLLIQSLDFPSLRSFMIVEVDRTT